MVENYNINIGRQIGSGGLTIGKKLADKLGISFYNNELIQAAAQKSGLQVDCFKQSDEKDSHSIFGGMFGMRSSLMSQMYSGYFLSNENLFQIQSDVIRDLAKEKSCLFIGRCADYVLKDFPRCLNIFICADKTDRVKRVAQLQQLSENEALDFIEKMDKKRASYYNYFSNKTWGDASSYHLCINSSVLGMDQTVDYLHTIISAKFGLHTNKGVV